MLPGFYSCSLSLAIETFSFTNAHIIHSNRGLVYSSGKGSVLWNLGSSVSCGLSYIPALPLGLTGIYAIVHDSVDAGKLVSLFFGFLTLFPVFFLLLRLEQNSFALFRTLVFALIPVLVDSEVGRAQRDPVCWFFLALGLLLFVHQMERRKSRFFLILSCFLFSYGNWSRIKSNYFIAISAGFILFSKQDKNLGDLPFFALPLVLLMLSLIPVLFCFDMPVRESNFCNGKKRIANKLHARFLAYAGL